MKDDYRNPVSGPLCASKARDKSEDSFSKVQFQQPLEQITQEEMLRYSAEIHTLFPFPPQQRTELVLMEIDPYRMYAYWHLEADDLTLALREAGSPYAPLVVRIQEVLRGEKAETAAASSFDISIERNETNRYMTVHRSGRSYVAQLGVRKADGVLVHLAESERVHLPRAGQAVAYDTTALDTSILENAGFAQTELASTLSSQTSVDRRAVRPPYLLTGLEAPVSLPSHIAPLGGQAVRETSWESSAFPLETTSSSTVFGSEQINRISRFPAEAGGQGTTCIEL